MLRYKEGNGAELDAVGILFNHVVAHNLHVAAIRPKKEVTDNVGLRIEGNAVVR